MKEISNSLEKKKYYGKEVTRYSLWLKPAIFYEYHRKYQKFHKELMVEI